MLVNGIPQTTIELNDRALAYGDGLFETIRLYQGEAVFLVEHLKRLQSGCKRLNISFQMDLLKTEIAQLADRFVDYAVLKIIVSRGSGGRGYRPATIVKQKNAGQEVNACSTKRILSLHNLPDYSAALANGGIKTFLCQQRLGLQPALAGLKHLNRLEQVMASLEWPGEEFLEGIMLDLDDNIIEGTKSNVFFGEKGMLVTPDLSQCGVNGILREILLNHFNTEIKIENCSVSRLLQADEVFVGNSVVGVWPVQSLKHGKEESHFIPGSFCRRAQQVFENAITGKLG